MASPTEYSLQTTPPSQPEDIDQNSSDALSNIPDLTTSPATDADSKIAAIKLIADSVAQQRQLGAQYIIFHPLVLAFYIAILAIIQQILYKGRAGDLAIVLSTGAGFTMAVLLGIRWMVGGYLFLAEEIGTWRWLDEGKGPGEGEDEILITRFGEEIIAAVVIRAIKDVDATSPGKSGGKKSQRSNSGGGSGGNGKMKGVIRAWTVRQRYRRKGVGGALLDEAVKLCREKGWSGPVFADDHANSKRVLPRLFNAGFDRQDRKARQMLQTYMEGDSAGAVPSKGKAGGKGRR
jgi:GNAT superfamily N-acetyltransferase